MSLVTVHIARSSLLAVLYVVSSLEYRLRQFDVGNCLGYRCGKVVRIDVRSGGGTHWRASWLLGFEGRIPW